MRADHGAVLTSALCQVERTECYLKLSLRMHKGKKTGWEQFVAYRREQFVAGCHLIARSDVALYMSQRHAGYEAVFISIMSDLAEHNEWISYVSRISGLPLAMVSFEIDQSSGLV